MPRSNAVSRGPAILHGLSGEQVYTINFLLPVLSAIPWKHHSFIACGIVYSCYAHVNNTGNELVIFPGIALKTDNKTL